MRLILRTKEFSFILATYDAREPLNRRLLSRIATGSGGNGIDREMIVANNAETTRSPDTSMQSQKQ